MPLSSVLGAQSLVRPGVCTSSTRPASPFEGQVIYETDTDKIMSYSGSAWQFVSVPQTTEPAAYSSHTVTWTNVTVGNGTLTARWTQINKKVHYYGKFTLGSTSSVTGQIGIDLPVNANTSHGETFMGIATLQDTGVATYPAFPLQISADLVYIYPMNTAGTYGALAGTSSTVPHTWGSTDIITWNLVYEAA